jgi:3-methyladenine DNA glycosylase/8-oxoguanine DNA glycosylase
MEPVSAPSPLRNTLNFRGPWRPAAERVNVPRLALETTLVPRPPYSLAASARASSDATRRWRDGVLTVALDAGEGPAVARVRQRPDGTLSVRIDGAAGEPTVERLRFVLAVGDDHREFLARFARDPLLGEPIRRSRGLRPLRTATVAHALVKAVCGQLIQASAARRLEARLLRAACRRQDDLWLPPTSATFAPFAAAELVRQGLAPRKAATLVRVSRELDPERLRGVPTELAATRIERERGLGPWSAGVVCLYGLGRRERGLVGDLGLIKLCAALHGRWADADDTRALLAPYGEWAGLASVYLLTGARSPTVPPSARRLGVGLRDEAGGRRSHDAVAAIL